MENYQIEQIKENYRQVEQEVSLNEWLISEIENNPEGFDCFFKLAWDEITDSDKENRIEKILNTVR